MGGKVQNVFVSQGSSGSELSGSFRSRKLVIVCLFFSFSGLRSPPISPKEKKTKTWQDIFAKFILCSDGPEKRTEAKQG